MNLYAIRLRKSIFYRFFSLLTAFTFVANLLTPTAAVYAQSAPSTILNLPVPGTMLAPSEPFHPPIIKGMTLYPDNPLKFDFILDTGEDNLQGEALKEEAGKLIKYFLTSLTVPEKDLWVNLSPHEGDRIVPGAFGQTEMGRDLLAQDYILKQLTASLVYPENDLGKQFWQRIRQKAKEQYGTMDIPMSTFNKVWIVPDKATVYEYNGSVFIVEKHLKVMLEQDYVSLQKNMGQAKAGMENFVDSDAKSISGVSSEVVREIVIPEIEKEVNEGKNFANLRQIYSSMLLATWYKRNLKESFLGQSYADQNKIKGVDLKDKNAKHKIYEQYVEAFKLGAYNYIKEDYDETTRQAVPRKYFSGGATSYVDLAITAAGEGEPAAQPPAIQNAVLSAAGTNARVTVESGPAGEDVAMAAAEQTVVDELAEELGAMFFGRVELPAEWEGIIQTVAQDDPSGTTEELRKTLLSMRTTDTVVTYDSARDIFDVGLFREGDVQIRVEIGEDRRIAITSVTPGNEYARRIMQAAVDKANQQRAGDDSAMTSEGLDAASVLTVLPAGGEDSVVAAGTNTQVTVESGSAGEDIVMAATDQIQIGETKFGILQGDITRIPSDAVIPGVDVGMNTGAGVGAIIGAVAPNFDGTFEIGGVLFPDPDLGVGRLKFSMESVHAVSLEELQTQAGWKYLISAVYHDLKAGTPTDENVMNALKNALREADRLGLESVTLPAMGTGLVGLGPRKSADLMSRAVVSFLASNLDTTIKRITIVLFRADLMSVFREALLALQTDGDLSDAPSVVDSDDSSDGAMVSRYRNGGSMFENLGSWLKIAAILATTGFGGYYYFSAPSYHHVDEPVGPALADNFEISEWPFKSRDIFTIKVDGESVGSIAEKVWGWGKQFVFGNAANEVLAVAKQKPIVWGVTIEVFDHEENLIGTIEERVFGSLFQLKTSYDIKDARGRKIATSEKTDVFATSIKLTDLGGRAIATIDRDFINLFGDNWTVNIADPEVVDSRILVMIAAYKTSADNDRREEEAEEERERERSRDNAMIGTSVLTALPAVERGSVKVKDAAMMTKVLRNGSVVSEVVVRSTYLSLDQLWKMGMNGIAALYELWKKARDPNYEINSQWQEILREFKLLESSGNIHSDVKDVVLSALQGENFLQMQLVWPIADEDVTEDSVDNALTGKAVPTPAGGVDLDSRTLDMTSIKDGGNMPVPTFRGPAQNIRIEGGLFFNILNVGPANLHLLFGRQEPEQNKTATKVSWYHPKSPAREVNAEEIV